MDNRVSKTLSPINLMGSSCVVDDQEMLPLPFWPMFECVLPETDQIGILTQKVPNSFSLCGDARRMSSKCQSSFSVITATTRLFNIASLPKLQSFIRAESTSPVALNVRISIAVLLHHLEACYKALMLWGAKGCPTCPFIGYQLLTGLIWYITM